MKRGMVLHKLATPLLPSPGPRLADGLPTSLRLEVGMVMLGYGE